MDKKLTKILPFVNIFAFALLTTSFFASCSNSSLDTTADTRTMQTSVPQKVAVVTSFYPLYEIARQVGGEYVDIKNLVPPGAEPHDYELTPKDIASVSEAQVLFVNGAGLEPWLDKVIPELDSQKVMVVNASKILPHLITGFHEEEEDYHSDSQEVVNYFKGDMDHPSYDPHVWLDPSQYVNEVSAFEKAIVTVDPAHKQYYEQRAKNYITQLKDLDALYTQKLSNCLTREFVTNHAAFGYLARRYNLSMLPIAGLSPDAEPSPKVLADLTDLLKQKGVKHVLVETLVSPKIAQTLAQEVGADTLVLNPLEGLADIELQQGQNYITVMQKNLQNLQIAMNCR